MSDECLRGVARCYTYRLFITGSARPGSLVETGAEPTYTRRVKNEKDNA